MSKNSRDRDGAAITVRASPLAVLLLGALGFTATLLTQVSVSHTCTRGKIEHGCDGIATSVTGSGRYAARLMVFRFSSQQLLLLASLAVGCGPEFQASFSPLGEAGAPADDGNGPSANAGGLAPASGAGGGQTSGSSAAGDSSMSNAPGQSTAGDSAGSNSASGSGGASAGSTNGSAGANGGVAGQGGACARRCDALEPWAQRSYTLGERVTSICKVPYNGTCLANTQHEFECQPPTGVVGLGWCSVRQPGVGNGWAEAWRISAACE